MCPCKMELAPVTFKPNGPIDPAHASNVLFLRSRIDAMVERLGALVEDRHNPLLHGFNQMVRATHCSLCFVVLFLFW